MPIMLLQNTNTTDGLVNGMTGSAEEVNLDKDVPGIRIDLSSGVLADSFTALWIELDDQYILCTAPLLCVLVRPTHDHTMSFSGLPDTLVPIFPVPMRGEIPSMSGLPFNRH
jgi:hypothetical protein